MYLNASLHGLLHWLARPHLSLVARYTLPSVFVMSIALTTLAVLYEPLAKDLLNRLTGERLDAQALSTVNRLRRLQAGFCEVLLLASAGCFLHSV